MRRFSLLEARGDGAVTGCHLARELGPFSLMEHKLLTWKTRGARVPGCSLWTCFYLAFPKVVYPWGLGGCVSDPRPRVV